MKDRYIYICNNPFHTWPLVLASEIDSSCNIFISSQMAPQHWNTSTAWLLLTNKKDKMLTKHLLQTVKSIIKMTTWTNQSKEDDSDDEEFHQSVLTWTMHLLPASKPLIKRSRSSNQRQIIANADQPSHLQMWLQPLDTSCIYSTNWNGSQIKD